MAVERSPDRSMKARRMLMTMMFWRFCMSLVVSIINSRRNPIRHLPRLVIRTRPVSVTLPASVTFPSASAKAISVNIAVTGATLAGNVRLHPGGTAVPPVSSINYVVGQTRSNNAIVPLDALGRIAAFAGQFTGTVHVIIDVNGFFQ